MAAQPPIPEQQAFWNSWNASTREQHLGAVSLDQASVVEGWLERLGRKDLRIIDVGCGAGWLASRLCRYGKVTATDLSDEVLSRARQRAPEVDFVAGDFMNLEFAPGYDVAVSLEVLSHVSDQAAFLRRISGLLRPGGWLMLATQNRPALLRNDIPPPGPGQLRRWVDRHELGALLAADFRVLELCSISPQFNRGLLKKLNSGRLRRMVYAAGLGPAHRLAIRLEERVWLGWTLMALAAKPTP